MALKSKHSVDQTKIVTTGSGLRIETPKSSRQRKPRVTVLVNSSINPVNGFVGFLRENAVVGLAVAFVIGAQVQVVVKQLIASFIDPLSQLVFGQALSHWTVAVHYHGRTADFSWGNFVYVLLNFLFVLLVIYVIIKLLNLDKLDKPNKK